MTAAAALWFAIAIVFLLLMATVFARIWVQHNQATVRGWTGELRARWILHRKLDATIYTTVNDIILPVPGSSRTTQVDHVVISRFGIVVIETKNLGGLIFGAQRDQSWTIKYRKQTHRMQNPLRQNYLHTRAVTACCGLDAEVVQSLVFLAGDGQPKTKQKMGPDVIYRYGLAERIKNEQTVQLDDATVQRCVTLLRTYKQRQNREAKKAHVASLRSRNDQP